METKLKDDDNNISCQDELRIEILHNDVCCAMEAAYTAITACLDIYTELDETQSNAVEKCENITTALTIMMLHLADNSAGKEGALICASVMNTAIGNALNSYLSNDE
tara:strand:- start:490 stop:810 length:321 start_codon:yes stop_codon:yes gene_type:complete